MKTGIYIGPVQQLQGENALLRPDEQQPRMVLAQFDRLDLEQNGAQLAFGWHLFERKDFQMKGDENE